MSSIIHLPNTQTSVWLSFPFVMQQILWETTICWRIAKTFLRSIFFSCTVSPLQTANGELWHCITNSCITEHPTRTISSARTNHLWIVFPKFKLSLKEQNIIFAKLKNILLFHGVAFLFVCVNQMRENNSQVFRSSAWNCSFKMISDVTVHRLLFEADRQCKRKIWTEGKFSQSTNKWLFLIKFAALQKENEVKLMTGLLLRELLSSRILPELFQDNGTGFKRGKA